MGRGSAGRSPPLPAARAWPREADVATAVAPPHGQPWAPLPAPPVARGLYIHAPFCARTCPYCDFYKLAPRSEREPADYLETLCTEARRDLPGDARYQTIFCGGGTPTELPLPQLERLVERIADVAAPGAEITFEANPGTASPAVLALLRQGGVNRLSIGAQTFDDGRLRRLGRIHDVAAIRRTVDHARAAGFASLNLDLIFAQPGQTGAELDHDLQSLLELAPDHVSAYCLTYEPGTPFGRAVAARTLVPLPEDDEAEQMERVRDGLAAAGLEPYEVSNFARPGHRCRHNLDCWSYQRYDALGPSAASFRGWARATRPRDLARWGQWVARPTAATEPGWADGLEEHERLDAATALTEVLMLGLRLSSGVTRSEVRERCGQDLDLLRGARLAALADRGWLEDDGERISLTGAGRLLATRVALELM